MCKLKIIDEKQKDRIESIMDKVGIWFAEDENSGFYIDDWISFDKMAEIVDFLRTSKDKKKDLFEECWKAYRMKGVKRKAKEYWNKLEESEFSLVLPHIKAYVASREVQYQKDFERYLRDRVFMDVVYNGNVVVYDPNNIVSCDKKDESKSDSEVLVVNGQIYR